MWCTVFLLHSSLGRVQTCKSALKTMQEAVKPLQRQIVQEMKQ